MELEAPGIPLRQVDPTERKDFGTKSDDDLGEYPRICVLVAP